jgi:surface antigen
VLAYGVREVARRPLSRWPLYSGTRASRLRSRPHRFVTVAALLSAFSAGGCAYQLDTASPKAEADVEQTGSIAGAERHAIAANVVAPSETDLAYARAVAADVVGHGAKDASIPWENPNTGAGGNITPLAASYSDGSLTCRDFLASYVRGQAQAWLQGEACRSAHGKWEVRTLRPFKQG